MLSKLPSSGELILAPIIQCGGAERPAHHARHTDLDLSGGRCCHATERHCTLTHLAPRGRAPLEPGPLALRSSIAASASLRRGVISKVSNASTNSVQIGLTSA